MRFVRWMRVLSIALVLAGVGGVMATRHVAHAAGDPGAFDLPVGATVTFTNVGYGSCNPLEWGVQLSESGQPTPLQLQMGFFLGGCTQASGPDRTLGPFTSDARLEVYLTDSQCQTTYLQDGTPVDHAIVSGDHAPVPATDESAINPLTVRFADGGGYCERAATTTNTFDGYNFEVTMTVTVPEDDIVYIFGGLGEPWFGSTLGGASSDWAYFTSASTWTFWTLVRDNTTGQYETNVVSSINYRYCPLSCDPSVNGGITYNYTAVPASLILFTIQGPDGPYEIDITVSAGSTTTQPWKFPGTYTLDNAAPSTTATAGGYSFGQWTKQSVSVALSASDNVGGSGVYRTYYATGNLTCSPSTFDPSGPANGLGACSIYTGPFSITSEGKHTLIYFSRDNVNNLEALQTKDVWIDTTPPTLNVTGAANGTIFNVCSPPTRPTFAPTDALSGVNSATVSDSWTSNLQPSGVGNYTYSAQATDNAGNLATEIRIYSVKYGSAFGGFALRTPPSGAFKLGTSINLKFQLLCGSTPISNAVVYLYAQPGSVSKPRYGTAGVPFAFETDTPLSTSQYVDVLSTGKPYTNPDGKVVNFTAGVWTLTALFDDHTTRSITISLQ